MNSIWILFHFFLCVSGNELNCPEVKVTKGYLSFNPRSNCTITTFYKSLTGSFYSVPGRWYGLITWSCGLCSGSEVSKFDGCDDGLSIHNLKISECRPFWFPLLVGSTLTILIHILLKVVIHIMKKNKLVKAWFEVIYKWLGLKYSGQRTEVEYNTVSMRSITLDDWMKLKPGHRELLSHQNTITVPMKRKRNLCKHYGSLTFNKIKSVLAILIIFIIGKGQVESCTVMIQLKTDGMTCIDGACSSLHTSAVGLQTGDTLCMKKADGTIDTISLLQLTDEHSYVELYKTSSYIVRHVKEISCEGQNGCWKNTMQCDGMNSRFDVSERIGEVPKSPVNGTFCSRYEDDCTSYHCFYDQMCHRAYWYYILDRPYGKVLKHYATNWKAELLLDNGKTKQNVILTGTNPMIMSPRMIGKVTRNYDLKVPISYLHIESGDIGGLYEATISDRGRPISGQIGEVQYVNDGSVFVASTTSLKCASGACQIGCVHDTPAMKRVSRNEKSNVAWSSNGKRVTVVSQSTNTLDLTFNTDEDYSLFVEDAKCIIKISNAMNCLNCNDPMHVPYTVVQVSAEGLMPIKSNCDLIVGRIKCSSKPGIIYVNNKDDSTECNIQTPYQNLTIQDTISVIGDFSALTMENSIGQEVVTIVTSQSVWKSLWSLIPVLGYAQVILFTMGCMVFIVIVKK